MQHTPPNLKQIIYRNMVKWLDNTSGINFKDLIFLAMPKDLQLNVLRLSFIELTNRNTNLRIDAKLLKYLSTILTQNEMAQILSTNLDKDNHYEENHIDVNLSLFDNLKILLVTYLRRVSGTEPLHKLVKLSEIKLAESKPINHSYLHKVIFKIMVKEYPLLNQIIEQHSQVMSINQHQS
jgi:hypothetical protein